MKRIFTKIETMYPNWRADDGILFSDIFISKNLNEVLYSLIRSVLFKYEIIYFWLRKSIHKKFGHIIHIRISNAKPTNLFNS